MPWVSSLPSKHWQLISLDINQKHLGLWGFENRPHAQSNGHPACSSVERESSRLLWPNSIKPVLNWLLNGRKLRPALNKRLLIQFYWDSRNSRRAKNIILEIENYFFESRASRVSLTYLTPRWFTCPQTVTLPSSTHLIVTQPRVKPTTSWFQVQRPTIILLSHPNDAKWCS